jgi:hypothetical protein
MENTNTAESTPKDVFLHLLNILTFYLIIVNFITLLIQYVGALFPDPLNFYYTSIANAVRLSTSILVVSVPVYILTSWMLGRDLKSNPGKRDFKLRKWLIYFTLFVAAVTIIVDLITFVYNFMSGELTVQFFLKILVVLLVAAAVFGYYIWDLKRKDRETSKVPKKLAWVISLVVLASIVTGFFIIGTPAVQRDRRFDEQRVGDLQTLQNVIVNYWMQKERLPQELSDLEDSISGFTVPKDPASEDSYEYSVIDSLSFELCATFKTPSQDFGLASSGSKYAYVEPYVYRGDILQQNWEHEAERTCFTRMIDPELYKPSSKQSELPVPAL